MSERGHRERTHFYAPPRAEGRFVERSPIEHGAQRIEEDSCLSQLRVIAEHHPTLYEEMEDDFGGNTAKICDWLNAANDYLEGNTPWEMISRGRSDLVLDALRADHHN